MLVQILLEGHSVRSSEKEWTFGCGEEYHYCGRVGHGGGLGSGRRLGYGGGRGQEENVDHMRMGYGNGDGTGSGCGKTYSYNGCCTVLPVRNEIYLVGVEEAC